ncbi:MAG TPA: enoyl-CoA hydratase/isomerase family protein [Burkholderiales bacterium]|nr:enoyl-CoA hydratase/isomerase family protein [Burkholderiales bacterium]
MYKHLALEEREGVLTVRMNRPRSRNALSLALMRELTELARGCEARGAVRAIVLAGGPDHFCAGADLKDPDRWDAASKPLAEQRRIASAGYRMCAAWEEIPQVTIAAIEGYAIGGGMALALACDFRVAAGNAFVSFPEISLGMPLTWGTIHRLVQLAGPAQAKRLAILCERIAAAEAREIGVIDHVAPAGEAESRAHDIARTVAAMPETVVRMTKESANAAANALLHLGSHAGADQFALAIASEEGHAARSRFTERKKI